MKRLISNLLFLLMIISCSENSNDFLNEGDVLCKDVISATIEQTRPSRSVVDYMGTVSWSENDAIGIFGEYTQNSRFNYDSEGEDMENFIGIFDTNKDNIQFAYYPYHEEVKFDGKVFSYQLMENMAYNEEIKTPMIGKPVSHKQVHFCQTGGMLLLKMIGLPKNAIRVEISSDEKSPLLSGQVVIENIDSEYPEFRIIEGSHRLAYDLSTLDNKEQMLRLSVPLQVGSYEQLKVNIIDQNNNCIKTLSLSNTKVARGTMINTRTINCSDRFYCVSLSEENLAGSVWDEGLITSTEKVIFKKVNDDKSSLVTLYDLRSQDELSMVVDSLGEVTELIFNDNEYLSVTRPEDGTVLFYYYYDKTVNSIEVKSNTNTSKRVLTTRAGVDKIHFFEIINKAVSLVDALKSSGQNVSKMLNRKTADLKQEELNLKNEVTLNLFENDEVSLAAGLLGATPLKKALEIATYTESKFNNHIEKYYNILCGATISVTKPKVIGNQLAFAYSVRNTSKIPLGNGNFDQILRKCYVSVKKEWNGTRKPGLMSVAAGEMYGLTDVVANKDFDSPIFNIPFEKGFTYYIVARIVLTTVHSETTIAPHVGYVESSTFRKVNYSSDIMSISSDNIGKIEKNSVKYEDNQVVFDFSIHGDLLFGHNMGVQLYHDGEKVWENYDNIGAGSRCVIELDKNDFDCNYTSFEAKAKGKWQIRSYVLMDITNEHCYSEFVDFDLEYNQYPSVSFINPIIQKTEQWSKHLRANDDDSEMYSTFFSYGLDIKGGFWMNRCDAKSDVEGNIFSLSESNIASDGQIPFHYSWTYSKEHPQTPMLWYDIVLRNGQVIQSENRLKFSGFPIDHVNY